MPLTSAEEDLHLDLWSCRFDYQKKVEYCLFSPWIAIISVIWYLSPLRECVSEPLRERLVEKLLLPTSGGTTAFYGECYWRAHLRVSSFLFLRGWRRYQANFRLTRWNCFGYFIWGRAYESGKCSCHRRSSAPGVWLVLWEKVLGAPGPLRPPLNLLLSRGIRFSALPEQVIRGPLA